MESVVNIDTDLEDHASTDWGLEDTSAQFILNLLTGLTSPQHVISRGIQNLHNALVLHQKSYVWQHGCAIKHSFWATHHNLVLVKVHIFVF